MDAQTAPTNEDLETQIRYAIDDLLLSAELDTKINLRDLTGALKVLSPECQSGSVTITENNYTQNNTQINQQNVLEHHEIVSLSPEDMNCEERFERIRRETREAIENNTQETELDKLERIEG